MGDWNGPPGALDFSLMTNQRVVVGSINTSERRGIIIKSPGSSHIVFIHNLSDAVAFGINEKGSIVGQARDRSGRRAAFIYRAGHSVFLNDHLNYLHPGKHLMLTKAMAINESGQIIASGFEYAGQLTPPLESSGYLLSPK